MVKMRRRKDPFGKSEDLPLFDDTQYPTRPGFTARGTSEDAARAMHLAAHSLRAKVYNVLRRRKLLTADEIAGELELSRLTIRPRVSELYVSGFIEPSGKYRPNRSGKRAIVWRPK